MKTNRLLVSILSITLAITGLAACGDDIDGPDNNGGQAGSGGTGGTGGDAGHGGDGGTDGEGGTGGTECTNTRTDCNECVTPEEDPYDACSEHTGGCVNFDNQDRVPGFPSVPQVP